MIVYKIHSCDCSYFILKNKEQRKTMRLAKKGKVIDWKELDFTKDNGWKDCTFSSFGGLGYFGINDPNVLNILKKMCKETLSIVNFSENEMPFHILSDLTTVDALDLVDSEYDALDENRILFIDKYVLNSKLLDGLYLLKLKRCGGVFCTNLFKDLYDKEKWSGFSFKKVWEKSLS